MSLVISRATISLLAHPSSTVAPMKIIQFSHRPTSINTLPVELLTRIFTLGAGYDYPYQDSPFLLKPNQGHYPAPSSFQTLASHVCHRWRQIARGTPGLWTSIHLRDPIHIDRARAHLELCSKSKAYLLDILVDTVEEEEHIRGVTLCRQELDQIFKLVIQHVEHWRSFHLKVRENNCKLLARKYLSTCGKAPRLETLQLYHFEHYRTSESLHLATHRDPVIIFDNTLPRLRNVSLIGVNLPWTRSPYLVNLHRLELALHPENIRPSYDCWHRMLLHSPDLQSLNLHYSGPKLDAGGDYELIWCETTDKIILERLAELGLTDLDPGHLCDLMQRLHLPNVQKMTWHLPDQDYSGFIDLITRKSETTSSTTSPPAPSPHNDVSSKISISSLLSETSLDEETPESTSLPVYIGPLPNVFRLESLVITALDCSLESWKSLLGALGGLKRLEVDFSRLGAGFWGVLAGESGSGVKTGQLSKEVLVPKLEVFKISGLPGMEIEREIKRRAVLSCLRHWIVRWSSGMKGEDPILDTLVKNGCWIDEEGCKALDVYHRYVKVDTFEEEDEEEEDEGDLDDLEDAEGDAEEIHSENWLEENTPDINDA